MSRWQETAPGVFHSASMIATIDARDLDALESRARATLLRRARLCAHANPEDPVHEMLICLLRDGYIRPHRHFKPESALVLRGAADLVLFEDDGRIREVVPLGAEPSGRRCFVRLPEPVFHTYLLRTESLVFLETTRGPLRRDDTEFAAWSPTQYPEAAAFLRNLTLRIAGQPE